MPAKGDEDPTTETSKRSPRYRRPADDLVRAAALRLVGGTAQHYTSQAAFRSALLKVLKGTDAQYSLGGARLRGLLVGVPGMAVTVRYTLRSTRRPLADCPVCHAPVRPLKNRTLTGDVVTLGYQCTRCAYWTRRKRRVPVRYGFARAGIDGGPFPDATPN